jgi:dihydrofolate synthase/folylpolyglutamate synthase
MTYTEALDYIASLAPRGWRLGLDRMGEFLKRAELEPYLGAEGGPQFLHVAGTNGKGSVTAYLQSILVEAGYRTGAFFSPYVYDPRERVQLGREMISPADLARLTTLLKPTAEVLADTEFDGATEFEFKTALAFAYWAEKKCEWVALEVGLGGRLDATNVVQPRASAIVSIGLDHTLILGATHTFIAEEKAGIIKPGVPVVVGDLPAEALAVVRRVAREQRSDMWHFGHEILLEREGDTFTVRTPANAHVGLQCGIPGVSQPHNMALAIAALDAAEVRVDPVAMRKGTCKAALPGRFETLAVNGKQVVLDGAHNSDAGEALRLNLERYFPGRRILLLTGMVGGHEPAQFYQQLKGPVERAVAVPIGFHRALAPQDLAIVLREIFPEVVVYDSLKEALRQEIAGLEGDDLMLIAGSFYLVGEAGRILRG